MRTPEPLNEATRTMGPAAADPYVFKWTLSLLPRPNWARAESVPWRLLRAITATSTASDGCTRAPEPLNERIRTMAAAADDP